MQTIKLHSRVGSDGRLKLDVPIGVADVELEVVVIIQPVSNGSRVKTPEELGWPAGFFEQTAGSIPDFFEFDRYEGLDPALDDDVVLDFDQTDDQTRAP